MSEEELDDYEATLELSLFQEYKAVLAMFKWVVETERRFYLANEVDVKVAAETNPPLLEVVLGDAWVWDMYRSVRFVSSVRVYTFRDVNVERLPEHELSS